ncbi:MAG: hypothetical protein H7834_16740, partial [Magnetococcus sp. YQC-9]
MTTNTTPDTPAINYNPNAWRDCTIPPFSRSDGCEHPSNTWCRDANPYSAFHHWSKRASLLTNFARLGLDRWALLAYHNRENRPSMELWRDDVESFAEILGVIHESIDLAKSAADAFEAWDSKH